MIVVVVIGVVILTLLVRYGRNPDSRVVRLSRTAIRRRGASRLLAKAWDSAKILREGRA